MKQTMMERKGSQKEQEEKGRMGEMSRATEMAEELPKGRPWW